MQIIRDSTESISFRLNSSLLDQLRAEAESKRMSTNALAFQIFSDHLLWHSSAPRAGFVTVPSKLVSKLLEKTTRAELAELARNFVMTNSKDTILVLRNEYNLETVLDVIRTWSSICGYQFRHFMKDNTDVYVIEHNMGEKWSAMIFEVLKQTYEKLDLTPPEFDISDRLVTFKTKRS